MGMKIIPSSAAAQKPRVLSVSRIDVPSYSPPILKVFEGPSPAEIAAQAALLEALHFSFIIYDPLDHLMGQLKEAGFTHLKKIDRPLSGTQAIACVYDKKAYLMFRGSASPLDWLYDFLFLPFYWPLCHLGFGTAWRTAKPHVRAWLKEIPPVDEFMICGHSLGGGLSHMAALDLAPDFKIDNVITFGAPKACFLWTADRYNKTKIAQSDKTLADITKAVVNQRDIVAKVPFSFLGFCDVGELIYIDQGRNVRYGADATSARGKDSMGDIDFIFNFMEEEKVQALGTASTDLQKVYFQLRQGLAWLAKAVPVLKIAILPSLTYTLVSLYFMRSGLAHMGDKYMSAWPSTLAGWHFKRYTPTKLEKSFAFIRLLLMGGLLLAGFAWGLYYIASWSIESLNTPRKP